MNEENNAKSSIKINQTADWYKENLKYFGLLTKSNNKQYLRKIYLLNEKNLIKIQAWVKGWLARRRYKDLLVQNPTLITRACNENTFMGVPLKDINPSHLFFLEENGLDYGFDINEIYEWLNNKNTNPYTNNAISKEKIKQIKRLYSNNNIIYKDKDANNANANANANANNANANANNANANTNANANANANTNANANANANDNNSPSTQNLPSYNALLTNFFLKLEALGCYVNMEGFKGLNLTGQINFLNSLCEEYESVKNLINEEDITYINNNYTLITEDPFDNKGLEEKIIRILESLVSDNVEDKENIALIFTLHLSKFLSPNNDELENYYINSINFLIEQIIQQNTFSRSNSEFDLYVEDVDNY